ncbi:MAG: FAD:protein FMN transferase [Alphaproteobacteria bacterium]|jgi:thiamine biosynthesis lipoprotein|nr:FAD:protein FMN transferase [Alphaproteobacteria bacterium]
MRNSHTTVLSRRRFIAIAAAATLLLGAAAARARRFEWQGSALGAEAKIVLYHPDKAAAEAAINACLDEISRLEDQFSLYRPASALNRLNAAGRLDKPSHDMRRLLQLCRQYGDLSRGAFDPSVQPLWRLYAEHFASQPHDRAGPDPDAIGVVQRHIDYRRIAIGAEDIRLDPGMALTLNGIAQGYITDRVADLLRARGWSDVLLNLGEIRALPGRTWSVALPGDGPALDLTNAAVATSAGAGSPFAGPGGPHHLLHPVTGRSAGRYASVSVLARTATAADALSTALYLSAPERAAELLARGGGRQAWLRDPDGGLRHLVARTG